MNSFHIQNPPILITKICHFTGYRYNYDNGIYGELLFNDILYIKMGNLFGSSHFLLAMQKVNKHTPKSLHILQPIIWHFLSSAYQT